MSKNVTREKVVTAATALFYQKGFDGTSVRDIAKEASVNVSLISYYFNGKQGLLEYAVTKYYETYLAFIETELAKDSASNHLEQLKNMIFNMIKYKIEHYQLTAFIEREFTLDSTFVREMTVTYLAKENYLLKYLLYKVVHPTFKSERAYLYIQLKGMLMSPFLLKDEWNYRILDEVALTHYLRQFTKMIYFWLDTFAEQNVSTIID